ncbi:MAG: hypothetical protein SOH48_04330 [Eubacteriales bacterium]
MSTQTGFSSGAFPADVDTRFFAPADEAGLSAAARARVPEDVRLAEAALPVEVRPFADADFLPADRLFADADFLPAVFLTAVWEERLRD